MGVSGAIGINGALGKIAPVWLGRDRAWPQWRYQVTDLAEIFLSALI
jgi:hypothetical protein